MRASRDKISMAAGQNIKERDYWLNKLSGDLIKTSFPYDHKNKKVKEGGTGRATFRLSPHLYSKAMELSKGVDVKLHILLVTGLFIVLSKYMHDGNKDIIIGSPISRQDMEGEFINTVLVFRNPVHDEFSFKELLLQVRQTIIDANENQNYPFEILLEMLNTPVNAQEFPLFDVAVLLENLHDKYYIQDIPYNMLFSFLKTEEYIEGVVEYNFQFYRGDTIKRIIRHYMHVLEQGLLDVDIRLSRINLLLEEEKEQILFEFNTMEKEYRYPRNKTLYELLEEQADRTPERIAAVGKEQRTGEYGQLTYRELNQNSDRLAHSLKEKGVQPDTIVGILVEPCPEMVAGILGILKAGGAYLPLEPEYPQERIEYMLKDCGAKILLTNLPEGHQFNCQLPIVNCQLSMNSSEVDFHHSSNQLIDHRSGTLAYVIYTSGSTGKPKGVMVEHANIVAYLHAFLREFNIDSRDTGIQLAPYSFDVFVEELFPLLIKGGRFIIPEASIMMDIDSLIRLIFNHQVSIIDCTPLLLNEFNKEESTGGNPLKDSFVRTFISGGDVLKKEYIDKLITIGRVYNTYGPTETTVCAAYYNCNNAAPLLQHGIPDISIGRPISHYKIYILNNRHGLLPVGVAGELCISGAGVARGYLNRPELTAERFINFHLTRSTTNLTLYTTGDLGQWLPDGNIRFLGRKDRQIKIRGYRVETGEIESRLMKKAGITEAVVTAREDKGGDKYLCAYVVYDEEIDLSNLRETLALELPHYMIPSFFVPLRQLPLTPTGKVDKKALPEPEIETGTAYAAPQNQVQKQLQKIWQKALGIESIGINDNFFHMGGHSLRGIQVINSIHRDFNVKIPLAEMFRTPTIKGLSEYIEKSAEDKFVSLEPVEEKEYYALSSAQKRLYILQQMELKSTAYNMPQIITLGMEIEKGKPEQTFKTLIRRHEILKTSFVMINQEPMQRVHKDVEFRIEYYDLATEDKGKIHNSKFIIQNSFIRPFDLSQAPLLRVGLIEKGEGEYILMTDMHHIAADGVSYGILISDFISLYSGEELAPLRLQYKDFSHWQNRLFETAIIKAQEDYWLNRFAGEIPVLNIPTDYPRPEIQRFEGDSVSFEIESDTTQALNKLAKQQNATLYIVLLAVYIVLLSKLCDQEDIIIGTPIAGRRHADLHSIIGMFVNTLVMRNYPAGHKTFNRFLDEVRERALAAFENQDYPFDELVDRIAVNRDTGRNPLFDVMFVLQNIAEQSGTITEVPIPGLKTAPDLPGAQSPFGISKFDMTLAAVESGNRLLFTYEYSTSLFKRETIERFIIYFKRLAADILENPDKRISQIEIISEEEKNRLLIEFNQSEFDYPEDKTIHELFADQAERTPDRITLVGAAPRGCPAPGQHQMTYRELDERSNRLACLLKEKGVLADSIVGIKMARSVEMIIGILGILKAGSAYLPIDPDYPQERIDYMLKDSNAALLFTGRELSDIGKVTPETSPLESYRCSPGPTAGDGRRPGCVDLDLHHSALITHHSDLLAYVIYTSGTTGEPKGVAVTHGNVIPLVINNKYIQLSETDRLLQLSNYAFDGSVFDIFGALLNGSALVLVGTETMLDAHRLMDFMRRESLTVFFVTTALFNTLVDVNIECFSGVRKILFGGERVSVPHALQALKHLGKKRILHMYGPTETTVFTTYYSINDIAETAGTIPIGKPISNTIIYILDKNMKPVPIGVNGEVYIGGKGTARGYLNRPELTAEKFIVYRSYKSYRTYILYKSGDLARWLPDGNIEFLDRLDHQVKIRGFRIELGEIESRLSNHPAIKEVVVTARPGSGKVRDDDSYLCAYIVSDTKLYVSELREYLARYLPGYMIPAYFVQLDNIPLNPSGKVDRNRLPLPLETEPHLDSTYVAPRTGMQRTIAETWKEVLGRDKVGIRDNFFDLGGNSLDFIVVSNKLKEKLAREIPVVILFTYPTISSLEEYLKGSENSEIIEEGEFETDRSGLIDEGKSFMQQTLKKLDEED